MIQKQTEVFGKQFLPVSRRFYIKLTNHYHDERFNAVIQNCLARNSTGLACNSTGLSCNSTDVGKKG